MCSVALVRVFGAWCVAGASSYMLSSFLSSFLSFFLFSSSFTSSPSSSKVFGGKPGFTVKWFLPLKACFVDAEAVLGEKKREEIEGETFITVCCVVVCGVRCVLCRIVNRITNIRVTFFLSSEYYIQTDADDILI